MPQPQLPPPPAPNPPTPGSGGRGGLGKLTVRNSCKGCLGCSTGGWGLGLPGVTIAQGGRPPGGRSAALLLRVVHGGPREPLPPTAGLRGMPLGAPRRSRHRAFGLQKWKLNRFVDTANAFSSTIIELNTLSLPRQLLLGVGGSGRSPLECALWGDPRGCHPYAPARTNASPGCPRGGGPGLETSHCTASHRQ